MCISIIFLASVQHISFVLFSQLCMHKVLICVVLQHQTISIDQLLIIYIFEFSFPDVVRLWSFNFLTSSTSHIGSWYLWRSYCYRSFSSDTKCRARSFFVHCIQQLWGALMLTMQFFLKRNLLRNQYLLHSGKYRIIFHFYMESYMFLLYGILFCFAGFCLVLRSQSSVNIYILGQ